MRSAPSTPPYPDHAAFLPLTLSAISASAAPGSRLRDRAWAAEYAAEASWHALLGDCGHARRRRLSGDLRQLSEAAGEHTGGAWWGGPGSAHRARLAEFELLVAEALSDGDGEEFAEACAGYDAALAQALVTARGRG